MIALRALLIALTIVATIADDSVSSSDALSLSTSPSQTAVSSSVGAVTCSWQSGAGTTYDLSLMNSKTEDYYGDDQYLKYRMNICGGVVSDPSQCVGAICSYWKDDGKFHQQYGDWSGSPAPSWALADPSNPNGGVKITFGNGRSTCQGRIETSYVTFKCNKGGTPYKSFNVREDFSACTLTIDFTSPYACPGGGRSDSSSGGLSGGSVFLILFFVFVPLYIVAGCYYNRTRKGQNGMEACPNIGFWRAIIDYSKAGCSYSYHKVKGWTSGGGSTERFSYQEQR